MYFNHSGIGEIYSIGFSNDEEKAFKVNLKNTVLKISKDGDTNYADPEKIENMLNNNGVSNE